MPIQAEIEGVGILEFPDDTPQDVIQATVKRTIAQRGQTQQPANPVQQADSKLMQAVNQSAGLADPLLNFVKQSRQPAQTGQASSQYVNPAVFAGEEVAPPPAFASEEARQRFERGVANIPRFGGPMLAPEGGPRGAVFSGLGEAIAQTIEKFLGQREGYDPKEIAASTTQGAIPSIPGSGFGRAAANVGAQSAGGMAAEAIRTEGENVVSGALLPGGITAAAQGVGGLARVAGRTFGNAAERAATIEKMGAQPTFGQAMPAFAGLESRVESKIGGRDLSRRLEEQSAAITQSVRNLTGVEGEGASSLVRKLVGALGGEEAQVVANASDKLKSAQDILERVRGTVEEQAATRALDEAKSAFEDTIKSTLFKGKSPETFRIVQSGRAIENLVDDAKSAFKTQASELYKPIDAVANQEGFDLALSIKGGPSVTQEAARIIDEYPQLRSGGANPAFADLAGEINALRDTRNPLSLNQLRQMRERLYDYANTAGEAFGTKAQRDIRNLAGKITQSINEQAAGVFGAASNNTKQGQELAKQLQKANEFYAKYRGRFDEYGVAQAFKPETQRTGQMAAGLTSEVSKQGIDAPAFKNLVSLIEDLGTDLKKAGAKNAPSSDEVYSMVRTGIVDPFIDNTTGSINYTKLADTLNGIERQSPGALKKLGFGSKEQLDKFVKFSESIKDKPTTQQLIDILNTKTPAGFAVANESLQKLPNLRDVGTVVSHLENLATRDEVARRSLLALRATEIENLLLSQTASGSLGANVQAVGEFGSPRDADKLRVILGGELFNRIKDDFLPGYKALLEYRRAAGQAGATVRGAAEEQLVSGAGQAVAGAVTGRPGSGAIGLIGDLINLSAYKTASKVLARAGGSTGYKKSADFMATLDSIAKRVGSSGNITALQKYADTGELPDEK